MKIAVLFKSNCLGFIIDTKFKMLGHNLGYKIADFVGCNYYCIFFLYYKTKISIYVRCIKGCNTENASSVFLLLGHPVGGADIWD